MSFYFWPDLATRQARTSTEAPYESGYYPDICVSWLWDQRFGGSWLRAMAREKDRLYELTRDSLLCRFPSTAPSDALPLVGFDRNITRGFGEDDASYRQRLLTAWTFWQWSGTGLGIVISLQPSGFVGIPWDSTETEFNPYYPHTSSSVFVIRNGDVDAGSLLDGLQFWSRFWVYIDSTAESITFDGVYDDPGVYDDGGVWDLDEMDGELITPSMVGAWKASIRQAKPADWSCASINIGDIGDVPGGLAQIPMDSYYLTLGLGETTTTTWFGQILDIVNWHAAAGSLTMETGETRYIDATFVVRCGSWSAWYRRIFAIESLPIGIRFVGASTLSSGSYLASGCEIASEQSALAIYTGGAFDIRAKLNATTNVLTFEAKGPATGLFAVNFREIEL